VAMWLFRETCLFPSQKLGFCLSQEGRVRCGCLFLFHLSPFEKWLHLSFISICLGVALSMRFGNLVIPRFGNTQFCFQVLQFTASYVRYETDWR